MPSIMPTFHSIIEPAVIRDAIPSQPNVLTLMEGLNVLMCPSMMAANEDREPGILVSKEAGTRDVPVIGRDHGNIPEIIDGQQANPFGV